MNAKKIIGILIGFMVLLISGCGDDKKVTLVNIKLDKYADTVVQNGTVTLPDVTAVYDNNEEKKVTATWDTIDTSKLGTTQYSVTYTENGVTVKTTFVLTVIAKKTLTDLVLSKTTDSTLVGSKYELSNKATAIYDNGDKKEVAVTWNKSVDTTVAGTFVYEASYTEGGITKTTNFVLTVKEAAKLQRIDLNTKTATTAQETVTTYKLPTTATATYEDGTTKTVTVTWNKKVDTTLEIVTIYEASYTEGDITKTDSFELKVIKDFINKVKKIEFNPSIIETTVNKAVTLPTTATATYEDGTTKTVTVVWLTGTTVDVTKIGTINNLASFTETYKDGAIETKTANLSVVVSNVLKSIALSTKTAAVQQNQSYTLPTTATATYEDGTTKVVIVKWDKAVSTTAIGSVAYVASYTEGTITKSDYFVLTVTKAIQDFTINTKNATVNVGEAYILPTTGTIVYSDNSNEVVNITWDKVVNTTLAGTYTYVGSCPAKTDKTVQFTLIVKGVTKGVLELADVATDSVGSQVEVVMSASDFSKESLKAEVTLTYDSTALEFTGVTLLGTVSTASKTVTTATGSIKVSINLNSATLLSGQIAKFNFKTLKSGDSQVKIGAANITDSTGVAYIETVISDIATVKVGSGQITNKIEINDAKGSTSGEVELTVSASGFTKSAMGVDVVLNYDTNYLDIARDSSGKAESSIVTPLNTGFIDTLMIVREVSAGKVQVAMITLNGSQVNLNGSIFKIKFKTKTTEGATTVSLGEVTLADTVTTYIENINSADTGNVTLTKAQSTDPGFLISDVVGTASSYINVKLTGENFKTAVGGVEFTLEYDPAYLSIEGENDITFTGSLAGAMKITVLSSGKAVIAATASVDTLLNGDIVNVKFKSLAKSGTTKITATKVVVGTVSPQVLTNIPVIDVGNIVIN